MMASRWRTITWLVTVAVHALSPVAGVSAEPWRHAYVDALPDEAFAVVHVRPALGARRPPVRPADGADGP